MLTTPMPAVMKRLAWVALLVLALSPHAFANAPDVTIHQFRFRGPAGAADEFVELRNPGDAPVDVGGWKVQACPATGGNPTDRLTLPPGTTIPARRYLLLAGPGYAGDVPADLAFASSIADGGGIRILNGGGTTIDAVGAPTANAACREGAGILGMPTSGTNTTYQRLRDTNDNAADFVGPQAASPRNLAFNAAPTVTLAPPGGASEGIPLPVHAVAADADGDPLSFEWSTSLGTLASTGADASLLVSDGPASAIVTVTVSDGALATSASATIPVANVAPLILGFADLSTPWGVPVSFAPVVQDVDAVILSYDWGPTFAVGHHIVTVTATDKDGASAQRSANVTAHARPAQLSWAGPTSGGYRSLTVQAQAVDTIDPGSSTVDAVPLVVSVDGVDHAPLSAGLHTVTVRLAPNAEYDAEPIGTTFDVFAEAPLAPTLTAAPGAAVGEIFLAWDAPDDGGSPIASYQIHRDGEFLAETQGLAFVDAGLAPGATYSYTLVARNGAGESPPSAPATSIAQPGPSSLPTPELPTIALAAVGGMFMLLGGFGRAWRGP